MIQHSCKRKKADPSSCRLPVVRLEEHCRLYEDFRKLSAMGTIICQLNDIFDLHDLLHASFCCSRHSIPRAFLRSMFPIQCIFNIMPFFSAKNDLVYICSLLLYEGYAGKKAKTVKIHLWNVLQSQDGIQYVLTTNKCRFL